MTVLAMLGNIFIALVCLGVACLNGYQLWQRRRWRKDIYDRGWRHARQARGWSAKPGPNGVPMFAFWGPDPAENEAALQSLRALQEAPIPAKPTFVDDP